MNEIVLEGSVTAIDRGDEFLITYEFTSTPLDVAAAYREAGRRGYTLISSQYYDADSDIDVVVCVKEGLA